MKPYPSLHAIGRLTFTCFSVFVLVYLKSQKILQCLQLLNSVLVRPYSSVEAI